MVNDQWLILQHWRGGLQVLLVTKNCFIILGRRFVMWWERRIDSLVGGRIDSLVGGRIDSLVAGRIAIRPYMCDTTLVLGIRWLHSSLFTTYPSSFTWLDSSLFILQSNKVPRQMQLDRYSLLWLALFPLPSGCEIAPYELCSSEFQILRNLDRET